MPTCAGPSPQEHMLGLAPSSGLPCPYLIGGGGPSRRGVQMRSPSPQASLKCVPTA